MFLFDFLFIVLTFNRYTHSEYIVLMLKIVDAARRDAFYMNQLYENSSEKRNGCGLIDIDY